MKKVFVLLCVLAVLLAACGGNAVVDTAVPPTEGVTEAVNTPSSAPTEAPPAADRTTVRFVVSDFEQPLYQDMIKAFEEENPDLHVEMVSMNEVLGLSLTQTEMPDDAEQRLAASADVVNSSFSREGVAQGLVRDLTPFIEADANFQGDDFYPGTLDAFRWANGTWSLPSLLNYYLFFYDKDKLDAAGVAYPEAGWTWDDMVARARDLTQREGDEVGQWGLVANGQGPRLIESRAGQAADYTADPPTPRFDDEAVVEAVDWYAGLALEEQVMPYIEPAEEGASPLVSEEQALIDGGQAAMWPDVDVMWWIRGQQGNIGVAPFPEGTPTSIGSPVAVSGLSMSSGTKQPEAAWRWMDYASRQPLGELTMGIKFLPARRSAAETGGYWDDLDEGLAGALGYAVENSYPALQPVGYEAFDAALNSVLQGEKTAEEAMAEAQQQAEAEIDAQTAEQAGATPVPTFVVAASEETPAAAGATTIRFAPGLGSLNLEPFRDLAREFNAANPDIVVDVQMADFLSGTPSLPDMAAAADCFEWYPSFQEARNREAILSLAPFVEADPSFPMDDYMPQAVQQFTYQGQLLGLPADITPYIIEYNKALFDAAGVDYPEPGWTWDEFLAAATELTQGEGDSKQYGFVPEFYELNDLLLLTERLGARLIDEGADPPAFTYDDPATVEAVQWYANLTTEHGVKPTFVTDLNKLLAASAAMMEREALITEGRAAMWTSSPTAALLGNRGELDLGAVPPPVRSDGTSPGSMLTTSGYFISSQTENREACWQWITFLGSQPAAVQGLPARLSVAQSDAFQDKVGVEHAEAYLASVGESDRPSAFQILTDEEWLGGGIYWYGQAFGQVLEGTATVEEALANAQKLADDYRACVIAAGDFGQETWQRCAQETDPTLPAFLFQSGG